jgi:uncharacterized membrane protein
MTLFISKKEAESWRILKVANCAVLLIALNLLFSCSGSKQFGVSGVYSGILPAASCPGIDYVLELRENGTFLERMQYMEHEAAVYIRIGSFAREKRGLICLNGRHDGSSLPCFSMEDSGLRLRASDGKLIEGEMADLYVLTRQDSTFTAGPALMLHGNEPFWGLTLIPGRYLHFHTLETPEWEVEIDIPDFLLQFQDSLAYIRIEHPDILFEIKIWDHECSDGMSDILYPMRSEVRIQNPFGERHYFGCARNKAGSGDLCP